MSRTQPTSRAPREGARPRWSAVLRALREVAGVSQAGWVALLQLAAQEQRLAVAASEDTLQRWEAGRSVPDAAAEAAIIALCRERGLLRGYTSGVLAGTTVTVEFLHALLADARLGGERGGPVLVALPARSSSNLPAALSSFVGRERELVELERALAGARLLTLTGTGGVGKTRLALELARMLQDQFPDGVRLVELASVADPALVPRAVAAALGVAEAAGMEPTERLVERLRTLHILLVLDNCEHLSRAPAELVQALLQASPSLRVLATSRQPLGVSGEHVWRVPPLSVPDEPPTRPGPATVNPESEMADSVRLFVERARAARADADLPAGSIAAVTAICRRLDGIPLAIELAAARTRVLTVDQIAARLAENHRLIGGAAAGRHQTLTAAIDWSYDLLTAAERTLFRRLAVFAGGCTLDAAEAICAGPPSPALPAGPSLIEDEDVLVSLTGLVEQSLVLMEPGPGGEAWYRLLEPLRQYAMARLEETDERRWLEARHAGWYLALVEGRAGSGVKGPEQAYWLARLDLEHENVRAALRRMVADRPVAPGLRLATAMTDFWIARGHFAEGWGWIEAALAAPGSRESGPRLLAAALNAAGILAARRGDYQRGRARLEECLDLAEASEDPLFTARALNHLGITAREQGDLAGARVAYESALAIFERLGDRRGIAVVHNNLGNAVRELGRLDAAVAHYETVLALGHERGDEDGIALALHQLGSTALDHDDLPSARQYLEDSLACRRRLGNVHGTVGTLAALGTLTAIEGNFARAEALFDESLALARRAGHDRDVAQTLRSYGRAALDQDDPRAREFLEESLAIARRLGDRATVIDALAGRSSLALAAGEVAEAEALAGESLGLGREVDFRRGIALALLALAQAAAARGRIEKSAGYYREALVEARELDSIRVVVACFDGLGALLVPIEPERSARLLGTAAALRERIGVPLAQRERPAREGVAAALRAALGDLRFVGAEAEGRATTLQAAVEGALRGPAP